jgi:hypothetical protein
MAGTTLHGLWDIDLTRLPGPLGTLGKKELHLWIGAWLKDRARKAIERKRVAGTRHLLFAFCDHYEPLHGNVDLERGAARVSTWRGRYPEIARRFRDADGRHPRHSYFFPGEQYDGKLVEPLAEMCGMGLGEVEVHLHHDGDTRETLRASLVKTLADLDRHGVVPKTEGGKPAWAFIHGNWCLANARRDRRWCGVDDEMELLWELGCYVDLTFPSAPDESQPGIVNSIYYPRGDVRRRRAYEDGEVVRVGTPKQDRLLLIEGPIALVPRRGRPALRIESGSVDRWDPPSAARVATWVDQEVTVGGRPEWVFVKVHTHGAPEWNTEVVLGDAGIQMHEALGRYNDGEKWKLHYVTAREMFNVARAAMDGKSGEPSDWFDYEIPPPAAARARG